jgi:hypothetical protein
MNESISNYVNAPTEYIEVEGVSYAYRSLGAPSNVPMVCLQHFTGTLDNWDPVRYVALFFRSAINYSSSILRLCSIE